MVSHDRTFLDNVVTQTIVSMDDGHWREYAGGWTDLEAARAHEAKLAQEPDRAATSGGTKAAHPTSEPGASSPTAPGPDATGRSRAAKLNYREQRELESLPARIESLESEQKTIEAQLADPASYQTSGDAARPLRERFEAIEAELLEALDRWEALESRR